MNTSSELIPTTRRGAKAPEKPEPVEDKNNITIFNPRLPIRVNWFSGVDWGDQHGQQSAMLTCK